MVRRVSGFRSFLFGCLSFCLTTGGLWAEEHPLAAFGPWSPLPFGVSYFNPLHNGEQWELWFCAVHQGTNSQIGLEGPSLGALERSLPRFDSSIVEGYDKHRPEREHPILSRTSVMRCRDGRYLCLGSIGPSYRGGASELFPALFVSPSGKRGNWKHLGAPKGEPRSWLEEQRKKKKKIRSDGGSVIEMANGELRMFVHGYGRRLVGLQAKDVDGPWFFERDGDGAILDLAPKVKGVQWLFPNVAKIQGLFILTGGDAWPPKEIWAAVSRDGKTFALAGGREEPLLVAEDLSVPSFKALRLAEDPKNQGVQAVLNHWDPSAKAYRMVFSSLEFDALLWEGKGAGEEP